MRNRGGEPAVPWYLWSAILAVTSAYVGGYWDISWHRSIGRDTFWTAPHLAIYACGVLAGVSAGYLILSTTLRRGSPLRDVSVRIWGLRGPLGAFMAAWGGMAMLVSAPFDDWWHNAYGLDVRIISPPHVLLAAGFFSIAIGTLTLLLAFMNRADGRVRDALRRVFLYVAGVALCESLLLELEYIDRTAMHSAIFYRVVAIGTPGILIAFALAARRRWACTIMAGVYTAFSVALLWLLPLFPAEPKLGPVYQPVTHFIPWEFPLLVVVPALAVDVVLQRTESWRRLTRALVAGLTFLGALIVVQWPFADFLMSPFARNWFFGTHYVAYNTPASSRYAQFLFLPREPDAEAFWRGLIIAAIISCVGAWIGIALGDRMRTVRR
jgi:hypothetical protein